MRNGKWFVVLDGRPGSAYDGIAQLLFSPDSRRFVYSARAGSRLLIVEDGHSWPEVERVGDLVFGTRSRHLACGAKKGDGMIVLLDGVPSREYDSIMRSAPSFRDNGDLEFVARRDGIHYRVVVPNTPQQAGG